MVDPTTRKTYPAGKGGTDGDAFENAIRRTDTSFSGKKPGKNLIGEDIPDEEQDEEEEEARGG